MSRFFKASDATSIALHALVMLKCNQGTLVRIKEIAETFRVSEAHLAKVLGRLVKAGIIKATRGPSGGYALKKSAGEISLLEIYETFEGKPEGNSCMFSIPACDGGSCDLGDFFATLSRRVEELFSKTYLSDIRLTLGSFQE